jgi:hypothetical protein
MTTKIFRNSAVVLLAAAFSGILAARAATPTPAKTPAKAVAPRG